MASKEGDGGVEERLNSLLTQLQSEYAILERIVYKNKNQHRRGSYFQYLMKVRRDLRLLQSVRLEEILTQCFYMIDGKKPKQKVSALESLKKKSMRDVGKYNFMERLLGAARLLSQMIEPMLKAASKISTLLAQSFFMGFSVTVLAVIARLRVLVQQILLDVVSVFNAVSSISNKRQSIKIIQGVDVFREYYPKPGEMITLECIWETDKFVLIERTHEVEITAQDMPPMTSTVKYSSIEAFLEDDEPAVDMADSKNMESPITSSNIEDTFDVVSSEFNKEKQNDTNDSLSESKINPSTHIESTDRHILTLSKPAVDPISSKRKLDSKSRVAFVSVKKPTPSNDVRKDTLMQKTNSSIEDSFSDGLIAGVPKSIVL